MKVFRRLVAIFLLFGGVGLIIFALFNKFLKKELASLEVNSNLNLPVYVGGIEVGTTPYEGTFQPGEELVKVGDFEANVNLYVGIKTVVIRNFDSKSRSYGETLSFEQTGYPQTLLSVVSDPQGGGVVVDGNDYGNAPVNVNGLSEGKHVVGISRDGYEPSSFDVNLVKGYKLTAFVDLKLKGEAPLEASTTESKMKGNVYVKILTTPNGFLRVRSDASTTSAEVARVHDGEKFLIVGEGDQKGWFDIKIDATTSGWISDTYAATVSALTGN